MGARTHKRIDAARGWPGQCVFRVCLCLFLLHGYPLSPALAEDVVVIVNRENTNRVDRDYVIKIYTGALKGWPDGSSVLALDQKAESEVRNSFYSSVIGKSPANMHAIWSQNIFTGKGLPPKVAPTDGDVKRTIAANKNAIGYIRASQVDGSIRVIDR
jgi:ABC-type phosphate transport system substrate-binding protein